MFLELDKKNKKCIAVIDDNKNEITYGELCEFSKIFASVLPKRTLIFLLAENAIGSLLGYIGSLSNRIVPLILSRNTDTALYERLRDIYQPEYLWIPEDMIQGFRYEVVYRAHGYALVVTGLRTVPLYNELSLLLPTSGSTGSPKLVRHSYRNIEANACNVALLFRLTTDEKAANALYNGTFGDNKPSLRRSYYFFVEKIIGR